MRTNQRHTSQACAKSPVPSLFSLRPRARKLVVAVVLTVFVVLGISSRRAQMQRQAERAPEKRITVHAEGRGKPFINLQDGHDLAAQASQGAANEAAQQSFGSPLSVAAADFDEDGVPDLVSGYAGGRLALYRGNVDAIYPNNPAAQQRNAQGTFTSEPFIAPVQLPDLPESPTILSAGDFNADGQQDILTCAVGSNSFYVLAGNGRGQFRAPQQFTLQGQITALATGQIGRADGLTDVAVAVTSKRGAQLFVYEHPEGAFKHAPEIFQLGGPATAVTIGNLDEDFYADVAVASGNNLTIIQGRGQAYPWDLMPDSGIKRPNAFVVIRKMPFAISALTIGRFGDKRGESLAILGTDGNIYRLEPNRKERPSNYIIPNETKVQATGILSIPADTDARNLATISAPQLSREEAEKFALMSAEKSEIRSGKISDSLQNKIDEQIEKFKNTDKKEIEKLTAEHASKKRAEREKAKAAFLKSISGKPSTLSQWSLEMLVSGSQFTNASASNSQQKMLRVNISDSNLDDILLLDSNGNQIQLVAQIQSSEAKFQGQNSPQVTSLETEGSPLAVLPMRLNGDALSDLVVLRSGASAPSVVLTTVSQTITVTSETDIGDCQPGNPCSLRNAILLANGQSGMDEISFNLGGGFHTIKPSLPLPAIRGAVYMFGNTNGNLQPLVEISGANMTGQAVDGLTIRGSNSTIGGLAITQFTSTVSGQSQIGGNGIVIESDSASPNNGNNVIQGNYLGIDQTGSFDKGNDATGLLIFDADDNLIGGTSIFERNVISGNGSQQKRGAGISVTAGNSNVFEGNIIGLNSLGTGKVGNSSGLFFTGLNNTFGGDAPGAGNTVSGNGELNPNNQGCAGIGMLIPILFDVQTQELLTFGNTISGNRFGTNPAGTQGFGNCSQAIQTVPTTGTLIGSIAEGGRNIISDNGLGGVACGLNTAADGSEFGFCSIVGNNVGTDITGTVAIPNDLRNITSGLQPSFGAVSILNNQSLSNVGAPGGTTPGGACTGFCNLISGNYNPDTFNVDGAILAGGTGTIGIFNNYVGTNKNGTQALPNEVAVDLASTVIDNFAPTFLLGGYGLQDGATVSFGNLISGNNNAVLMGVGINNRGDYFVLGNRIGTDASGTFAVPNGGAGVTLNTGVGGFNNVQIGDPNLLGRNIISGNSGDGIAIFFAYNVNIANNLIGVNSSLNPLGNGRNGINISGIGTFVGGGQSNAANTIQNNGKSGVVVNNGAYINNIRGNSIYNNGALGIDLGSSGFFGSGDGVTANDCQDADIGANYLQNFPDLIAPVQNGDGTVTVSGALRSNPQGSYTIDFYSSAQPDPSGYGEGAIPIGSVNVTTDPDGFGEFTFTSAAPVSASLAITATATDRYNNTSEFSQVAGTGSFASLAELAEALAFTCAQPITVTVTSDENDANINDGRCDVDTITAGEQCTLRAAIQEANRRPGFNMIQFFIGQRDSLQTISPLSSLPTITESVDINATTQAFEFGSPIVELRGDAGGLAVGLTVESPSVTIRGFVINHFQTAGIFLASGANHHIQSNYIGINLDGTTADANFHQQSGIFISGSNQNIIGGTIGEAANVISNNLNGIFIQNSTGNGLFLNKIGTDKAGSMPLGNDTGIVLTTSASVNVIGNSLDLGNVISGNNGIGIAMLNSANNNTVTGNHIGTNASGMAALPNGQYGIYVADGANNNSLGSGEGFNRNTRNIISGQNNCEMCAGILIAPTAGIENHVEFNYIGVNEDATAKIPNRNGVVVFADKQRIGSSRNGNLPNVISGNQNYGVYIAATDASPNGTVTRNSVENNNIGTNRNAPANDLGNGRFGILLEGKVTNTLIKGNTVSGNTIAGIYLIATQTTVGPSQNQIISNQVGVSSGGDMPIPNIIGILLKGASNNKIQQNTVSGNTGYGIILGNFLNDGTNQTPNAARLLTSGNSLIDNQIGTDGAGSSAVPNGKIGLVVSDYAQNNCIGSCSGVGRGGFGNTISGQTDEALGYGIFLGTLTQNPDPLALPTGNTFRDNIIGMNRNTDQCLPNRIGMFILAAGANQIGVKIGLEKHGNIINCNTLDGISVKDQIDGKLLISSNYIGTTPTFGNFPGLGWAVRIEATGTEIIRSPTFDIEDNTLGNHLLGGIQAVNIGNQTAVSAQRLGGSLSSIIISANNIGVNINADGVTQSAPNGNGIVLENVKNAVIGQIAGSTAALKNIISGNTDNGIMIEGDQSADNIINNSIIGTNEGGATDLGNGGAGVLIINALRTTIGNLNNNNRNSIAGNGSAGVFLSGISANSNKIINNLIGVAPNGTTELGNLGDGVLISEDAKLNEVGGRGAGEGNIIAYNGGSGVRIDETAGHCNLVDPNSIFNNQGLGIDIGELGITPNDPADPDTGPNQLQNFPVITAAHIDADGNLQVTYVVDSAPGNANYGNDGLRIEFFHADACERGQGQIFIGSDQYSEADYNNGAPGTKTVNLGNAAMLGIDSSSPVVSTATDADGNTSEFSLVFTSITAAFSRRPQTANPDTLIISEFRLRGPVGPQDEFIEFYNNTDAPVTVNTTDGSAGWTLAALNPDGITITLVCTIPNNTTIPARTHLLATNDNGYSLTNYAAGDIHYMTDLPDNAGLSLFNTADQNNFTAANQLDAVGFNLLTGATAAIYREGGGLVPIGTLNKEASFVRKLAGTGLPQDTNDNGSDFQLVATEAFSFGCGRQATLGAPAPEKLASPIQRNATLKSSLVDPLLPSSGGENRVRDTTSDPANHATHGTLSLRRKVTNATGAPVTALRFRIVEITTAPAPPGQADLRVLTSPDIGVTINGQPATIRGTTVEQAPAQPNGGGLNSSLAVGVINMSAPLAPGASVNVQFLLGVEQLGNYRFFINVEALTGMGGNGRVPISSLDEN